MILQLSLLRRRVRELVRGSQKGPPMPGMRGILAVGGARGVGTSLIAHGQPGGGPGGTIGVMAMTGALTIQTRTNQVPEPRIPEATILQDKPMIKGPRTLVNQLGRVDPMSQELAADETADGIPKKRPTLADRPLEVLRRALRRPHPPK